MLFQRCLASLLCCSLAASSCTTLRDVPLPASAPPAVPAGLKIGDNVIVTLRDGTSHKLKVVKIAADAVTGKTGHGGEIARYAYSEMQALDVRRVSFWKTSSAVGATLLVVGTIAFAAILAIVASNHE